MNVNGLGQDARRFGASAGIAALFLCTTSTLSVNCINPDLVNTASSGSVIPLAPTAANDFVMVQFVNNSSFFIDALVTVDVPDTAAMTNDLETLFGNVRPNGGDAAVILRCPVDRVGLGDLDDLSSIGFRTALTPGANKAGVAWGNTPLVSGFNFVCGDTILLVAINDANAIGAVRIDAGIISGAAQPVPSVNTFGALDAILTASGF
jgi:hypothetical protein